MADKLRLLLNLTGKKNYVPDRLLSSGQDFDKNFLDSKHVLKVYFKPSRENPDFGFLPLPLMPVWLKNPYLKWTQLLKLPFFA